MIAVNELVQEAYEALQLTGIEESTEGSMAKVGCRELNRLIADLNSEGFIAMAQKWVDVPAGASVVFKKLYAGEIPVGNVVNMEPPEKVEAVGRKVGMTYLRLAPCDPVQLASRNPLSIATSWCYDREFEELPTGIVMDDGSTVREVGTVRLDGRSVYGLRVWYNSKLPKYELDGKIYLSDLYNNLLFYGLKYSLACFYDLTDAKKEECLVDFADAKRLIKRNNITQRMLQNGGLGGSYNDSYDNGMAGDGF